MWLKFNKMHGLGNDFIVIDSVTSKINLSPAQIRKLADRHFGIGFDQLLIIDAPSSPDVDFNYRIFNSDGSEVEQCGNGARCFAKYVHDRKLSARNPIRVQTLSGRYEIGINADNTYSVDMGVPQFAPSQIPFTAESEQATYTLEVDGQSLEMSVLSMGNPHAVLVVDDTETAPVNSLGPILESHPSFPNRANIGFMQLLGRNEINLRVYERGAGETLACGSGACAAVVAGIRLGKLDNEVNVNLPGGSLKIYWPGEGQSVILSGPAKTVFHGQVRI
jgi:diaminopimelate epimerase